ncbi:MAG: pgl 1 [Alphaproteobacteria bacterium]|nr:pgl 1 [Alphaproteobacteria bacterium]
MTRFAQILLCAVLALGGAISPALAAGRYIAYVGTYTGEKSKGIYALRLDPASGKFESLGLQAEVDSPSFVATDPHHRFLYALTERTSRKDATGYLSSYAIDPATGALRLINKVAANGTTTGHLAVDGTGRWLLVANYGSGSVAVFALGADGAIGAMTDFKQHEGSSVDARRQRGPHPHEVVLSSDNRFAFVPDLGLDKVFVYRLDTASGKLTAAEPAPVPPGFGPRHMIFGRGEKFAYVLGEMGSKVIVLSYDKASGALTPVQTIATIPADFKGENNSAELALDASGRFLYATNRGHDSVSVFAIHPRTGQLSLLQVEPSGGKIPRGMTIDPAGTHLLAGNQDSDGIAIFNRDRASGKLTATGQVLDIPSPVCILFVPLDGN